MTDILRTGLDNATVELDGIVVDDSCREVTSFSGDPYLLGVNTVGVLLVASATKSPHEFELSYAQVTVAKFALEHTGLPFKASDVIDVGERAMPKDQFNSAVFDKSTGLWALFNDIAGYNNLWYRDRNLHQLGDKSSSDGFIDLDSEPLVAESMGDQRVELKPEQEAVISSCREIIRNGRIAEVELTERLSEHLPEYDAGQIREILHSAIHRVRSNMGEYSFGFATDGKGAKTQKFVTMDPSLYKPSVTDESYVQSKVTAEQTEQSGVKSSLITQPNQAQIVNVQKDIRGRAVGSNAIHRANKGKYDPEASKAGNLPIRWKIDKNGFTVNGEVIQVHPDILKLINCVGVSGDSYMRMSDLSVIFNGGRMPERQFKKFVVWSNIAFDQINKLAPVVIINNFGRATRRDKRTIYKYNQEGDWASINGVVAGEALIPYEVT